MSEKSFYTLSINSSNVIGNNNNTFQFNFLNGSLNIPEHSKISLASATIPYSFKNITNIYSNNKFNIYFPVGASYNTYNLTLPNGFYQISDISYYIQQFCITNGLYLINASGSNVYYLNLTTNTNYYAIQLLCTLVPSSLPVGYTQPSNWVGYPTVSACAGLGVLNNFGSLIGYTAGNYPSTFIDTIDRSFLSNTTPNLTFVNSLTVHCNLCSNDCSFPTDLLDAVPINTVYGANINYLAPYEKPVSLRKGIYGSMLITLCDQNNNLVVSLDPNVLINLRIEIDKNNKK